MTPYKFQKSWKADLENEIKWYSPIINSTSPALRAMLTSRRAATQTHLSQELANKFIAASCGASDKNCG